MRDSRKPRAGLAVKSTANINKKETDKLKEPEVVEVKQSSEKKVSRRKKTSSQDN